MPSPRPDKEPLEYVHLLWAALGLALIAGLIYVVVHLFFLRA